MRYFFSAVCGSLLAALLSAPVTARAESGAGQEAGLREANCRLEPRRDSSLSVSVRDVVAEVHHRLGERVAAGDVLLELAQGRLDAQIREAEVTLEAARQKRRRAERMKEVLSVAELSEIESELAIAQSQYDGLLADRRRYVLRAPHDGVVIDLMADVGEVAPEGPLVRLVQVDTLKAELDVPGHLHAAFAAGDMIDIALPDGRVVPAEISFVDVLIEPVSQTFRLHALIDNPDRSIVAGTLCSAVSLGQ